MPQTGEDLAPIVQSSTHVVDAEPGVDVDVQTDALAFPTPLRADMVGVAVGDVVVCGRGSGFLRRVTAAPHDENGTTVFPTEAATLTDVFQQAQFRAPMAAAATPSTSTLHPSTFGVALPQLSIKGIRLPLGGAASTIEVEEGSFEFSPLVDYDFAIKDGALTQLKLAVGGEASASLKVKYAISRPPYVGDGLTVRFGQPGLKVADAPQSYVVLWVGDVPVVVVVKMELFVGYQIEVGGDVSGETAFHGSGSVSTGVSYDGTWHDLDASSLSVAADGPATFSSLSLGGDVTLTAKLSLSLYDVGGPWVELQGYAGLGYESGAAAPLGGADVYGEVGVRGIVGVEAAPFGKLVVGYQSVLFDDDVHVPVVRVSAPSLLTPPTLPTASKP